MSKDECFCMQFNEEKRGLWIKTSKEVLWNMKSIEWEKSYKKKAPIFSTEKFFGTSEEKGNFESSEHANIFGFQCWVVFIGNFRSSRTSLSSFDNVLWAFQLPSPSLRIIIANILYLYVSKHQKVMKRFCEGEMNKKLLFAKRKKKAREVCEKRNSHRVQCANKASFLAFHSAFHCETKKEKSQIEGKRGPGGFLWSSSFLSSSFIRNSSQNILLKHENMCARRCWRLMSFLKLLQLAGIVKKFPHSPFIHLSALNCFQSRKKQAKVNKNLSFNG